jgi:methyl-accepting chemotaxis protein
MSIHPIESLTRAYAGESLFVRKKSRILATLALAFCLISLVFVVLMAATKAIVVAGVFTALALLCAVVLALLRSGRYYAASSFFLYGVFAAMFIAIKFDQYVNVYETYVFGTLGCFLLIVATLVANRPSQAVIIGIMNLAAIEALYWLDSYPKDGAVTTLAIQNLAVSSLMVGLGAAVAAYLASMTTSLIRQVEAEAEEAARGYADLGEAMTAAQSSSQRIGESLSASVARTVGSIEDLSSRLEGIARGMDELDEALGRSGEANRKTEACQDEVKSALTLYSEQVSRASSAIEEMAAAAASLGNQASAKREAVRELVETSRSGESVLSVMGKSIEEIQASARRVAELSAIIGDVADRTNLLGMNASIEAAHAGQAGKGFAVVANEIRSLSVETAKSARIIADTLKQVESAVAAAAANSGEAMSSFRRIGEDIRGVSLMLDELLSSVQELSSGSADVVSAVEAVADLTRSTDQVVGRSSEGMGESLEGMDAVAEIASRVRVETSEMSQSFVEMRRDSDEVKRLGGDNLGTIQALKSSLERFARKEGAARADVLAVSGDALGAEGEGAVRSGRLFVSRGIRVKKPAR